MIITKNDQKYIVDEDTGELILSSTNTKQFDEREHRARSFYYLHEYRKYAYKKSLRLCHITSLRNARQSQLAPTSLSAIGESSINRPFKEYKTNTGVSADSYDSGSAAFIFKGLESEKAHIGGVATCSSVWACPICSQKITTKRANILKSMTDQHSARGGYLYLVTLTVPHGQENSQKTHNLKDFLHDLTDSYRKLTSSRKYKEYKSKNLLGVVRSFEITYGDFHGWHPHFHLLLFSHNWLSYSEINTLYLDLWKFNLKKKGYFIDDDFDSILVDVRGGKDASMYVAKFGDTKSQWQMSDEITKSNRKKAKMTSKGVRYTPFSLLHSWVESSYDTKQRNQKFLKLFQEYEKAFSGKNQLVITKGLYSHFNIEEKSDSLLNDEMTESSIQLASLSFEDWSIISKNNLFSEVLTCAETGTLNQFLASLCLLDLNPDISVFNLFSPNESKINRRRRIDYSLLDKSNDPIKSK